MPSLPALIQRLRLSHPPVRLLHQSHSRWPLSSRTEHPSSSPLRISILDASFNPPTLAHLALANSPRPGGTPDYDARLLLLSVRNADKSIKPGDASYSQRIDMMHLLSNHITNTSDNVAIAIIDEPTFVGKSQHLLSFLSQRISSFHGITGDIPIQLFFLLGFDTLERLVAPRYYDSEEQMLIALRKFFSPPPAGDDSHVVCARRVSNISHSPTTQEGQVVPGNDTLIIPHVDEFTATGHIEIIDIGETESTYSSTAIRNIIGRNGLEDTSWRSLVTNDIAQYIVQQNLYRELES
ncbi:hypothetical protein AMATHDRAFT_45856 [Amanita thiersii Skay4041]|uniref:Nicotinamide-nucleotide adenylyltransferase n=1 Tax=Amanita thiersii Skay4041 TaxID=703135 RepID=A0A2A9NS68_9AGAR|nr:hypothetical protein AMATHDRAFT_45856 [Amanita thiersii Skay4041]